MANGGGAIGSTGIGEAGNARIVGRSVPPAQAGQNIKGVEWMPARAGMTAFSGGGMVGVVPTAVHLFQLTQFIKYPAD